MLRLVRDSDKSVEKNEIARKLMERMTKSPRNRRKHGNIVAGFQRFVSRGIRTVH
jgi:hypothetical protein